MFWATAAAPQAENFDRELFLPFVQVHAFTSDIRFAFSPPQEGTEKF
jgi:hypothetical protein